MAARPVRQLRVVLNTDDLPAALAFYRDALGLTEEAAFAGPGGAQVTILDAGRATLELANAAQSAFIAAVETGGAASTPVRLAFEVDDSAAVTARLGEAGADVLAEPVRTPWSSLNARFLGPEGLHVTVFQELATAPDDDGADGRTHDADDDGAVTVAHDGVATVARDGAATVARNEGATRPTPGAGLVAVGDPVPDGGEAALLALAVELASRNVAAGGQPFGAVAVRDGVVVGVGVNTVDATHDPTAHAEVEAVRDAARRAGTGDLRGVVVHSSCEPCPVCRVVAAAAGVDAIVYAASKDVVPGALGGDDAALRDAVTAARPDLVRLGSTTVDVSAPFTAWLGRR
ncbi:deaminase [Cellulomonas carbonis]|uniref:Glyoxalase n=1 Tax=Cellulomonas carbonis T26 TaxID=947969 RepID=A0A0A0BNQ9_9CELL|nr:deaminase [Cellulomonas carbonis]KGM09287.1 glyoxalase [Cellulomonas carbonis T26]